MVTTWVPPIDDSRTTAELLSTAPTVRHYDDVVAYLAVTRIGQGFPVAMVTSTEREPEGPGSVGIVATMRVRERDTGKPMDVHSYEVIYLPTSNHQLMMRHSALVQRLLEHELLENYYVAGRRLLDPHKDDSKR